MKKYMIEREIPEIGSLEREQLQARCSRNQAAAPAPNRIFSGWSARSLRPTRCNWMYLAKDEELGICLFFRPPVTANRCHH